MYHHFYSKLKQAYQQSWFKFVFMNTALGRLLAQDEAPSAWVFFNTYFSSWWLSRFWLNSYLNTEDSNALVSIAASLNYLRKNEMFTEENCNTVIAWADGNLFASYIATVLHYLDQTMMLNQENLALVANFHNAWDLWRLASALSKLKEKDILTSEISAGLIRHADPKKLADALIVLKNAGILSASNQTFLITQTNPDKLADALIALKNAGILNTPNQTLLTTCANPDSLAGRICNLGRSGMLTQDNLVIFSAPPAYLVLGLQCLEEAQILTQENFTRFIPHANSGNFYVLIFLLKDSRILTQEIFNELINPHHEALFTDDFLVVLVLIRGNGHLNLNNFRRLVRAAEHINPMTEFQRIQDEILVIQAAPAPLPGAVNLNPLGSTHTASVHRSVSESAQRLTDRYGKCLEIEETIKRIIDYINSLTSSFKTNAAKRCIQRVTADNYLFKDVSSNVSFHQLLALTYIAIHDEANRQGSLEDALGLFVEGLYEIQRGGNLDLVGRDNQGKADSTICASGAFNKLMEKLSRIHSDVEVHYITHDAACLKFPKLAQQYALNYLDNLACPQSKAEYLIVKKLLDDIKANGLESIWDKIKMEVAVELWDEFYEAYAGNENHPKFIEMIESGIYINSPDLSKLNLKLKGSPGQRDFLKRFESNMTHSTNEPRLVDFSLWANRQQAPENQQAFDKQYGLVVFKH